MKSYISEIVEKIKNSGLNIEKQIIVFPSQRAGIFFKEKLIEKTDKTIWSPEITTIQKFISKVSGLTFVDSVDLNFIFYQMYLEVTNNENVDTFETFLNWSNTALSDFSEIDKYLIDEDKFFSYLVDIKRIENLTFDKPSEFLKNHVKFWSKLGENYKVLKNKLLEQSLAYNGLAYRIASEKIDNYLEKIPEGTKIHFIGFNALSIAEEKIFQTLLAAGKAKVYWDYDTYYFDNQLNEAGSFLRKFKNTWKYYKNNEFEFSSKHFENSKKIEVIGVPKASGQAKVVGKILTETCDQGADLKEIAIVLTDEKLLLPIINSIPQQIENVNITMGFPLKYAQFSSLFLLLFEMNKKTEQFNSFNSESPFYFENVFEVLRNEIVKTILRSHNIDNEYIIEKIINQNLVFIGIKDFNNENNFLKFVFTPWDRKSEIALQSIIKIIEYIKDYILQSAVKLLITLEQVYYFYKIFNKLQVLNNKYNYITNINTLSLFFNKVLTKEKLSFIGEPLLGLQVLGLLETRVLDFKTLIMTSVNEGVLPPSSKHESFIPFDIRIELGLPTFIEEDAAYAYQFYRLIQRAEQIYILYNTEHDDFGSGEKSRFVLQLQNEAKKNVSIIEKIVIGGPSKLRAHKLKVIKNQAVSEILDQISVKGLSPSALSIYIKNPIEFYTKKVLKINEDELLEETIEYNTLGNIIHSSLYELYKPLEGKYLQESNISEMLKKLDFEVKKSFEKFYKNGNIEKGKNLIIAEVVRVFIKRFLKRELENIRENKIIKILKLEVNLETELIINAENKKVKIIGTIDRIDQEDGKIRIIDYKTGKIEPNKLVINDIKSLFEETELQKSFQVLTYSFLFFKSKEFSKIAKSNEVNAGIFSLKSKNSDFFYLTEEKNPIGIKEELIFEFQKWLVKLLAEIFDTTKAFEEKE